MKITPKMWPRWSMQTDFLVLKNNPTNTHSRAQEVEALGDNWRFSSGHDLTGGCLSFMLPARGLILSQQPCCFPCSRLLTGNRKQSGLSLSWPWVSGTLSNDTNCSPLTAEEWTRFAGSAFFNSLINSWDPCSVTFMAHLSSILPELTFPHSLNLALRHCTGGQLKRCDLAVSHISSTFFTAVIVGICSD